MLADEDRVRAMIGLTRYENGSGKEALRLRKYYRTDYLALELIKTFFLATIAYILILTLLIAGMPSIFWITLTAWTSVWPVPTS